MGQRRDADGDSSLSDDSSLLASGVSSVAGSAEESDAEIVSEDNGHRSSPVAVAKTIPAIFYMASRAARGPDQGQKLRTLLVRGISEGSFGRRYIIHDIIEYKRELERRAAQMARGLSPTGTRIPGDQSAWLFRHGEHIHVIHDCNFAQQRCRCQWYKEFCRIPEKFAAPDDRNRGESGEEGAGPSCRWSGMEHRVQRYKRAIARRNDYSTARWENLFRYAFSGRRYGMYIKSRAHRLNDHQIQLLQKECSHESAQQQLVEICDFPGNTCDQSSRKSGHAVGSVDGGDMSGTKVTTRSHDASQGKGELQLLIENTLITPLSAILHHPLWVKSKFRSMHRSARIIDTLFTNIQILRSRWSLRSIFEFSRRCDLDRRIYEDKPYYSVNQSIRILERLLHFQMGDTWPEFLSDLADWLDRRQPKRNAFIITGEWNSGKNYFFDALCSSMLNMGIMGNWNRNNNFPLQDCIDKRVLLWNEPNFEDGAVETLKKLFGGDSCEARIKYQHDGVIHRTPICVLQNPPDRFKNPAFNTRCYRYNWITCPHLRQLHKWPNPLSFLYLLVKYNFIPDVELCNFEKEMCGIKIDK